MQKQYIGGLHTEYGKQSNTENEKKQLEKSCGHDIYTCKIYGLTTVYVMVDLFTSLPRTKVIESLSLCVDSLSLGPRAGRMWSLTLFQFAGDFAVVEHMQLAVSRLHGRR